MEEHQGGDFSSRLLIKTRPVKLKLDRADEGEMV